MKIGKKPLFLSLIISLFLIHFAYGNDEITALQNKAEQGDFKAQLKLGFFYYEGQGVEADKAEAIKWYSLAAEQGDDEAQYNIGIMYYNEKFVNLNRQEGMKWLEHAAAQGNIDAQNKLKHLNSYAK